MYDWSASRTVATELFGHPSGSTVLPLSAQRRIQLRARVQVGTAFWFLILLALLSDPPRVLLSLRTTPCPVTRGTRRRRRNSLGSWGAIWVRLFFVMKPSGACRSGRMGRPGVTARRMRGNLPGLARGPTEKFCRGLSRSDRSHRYRVRSHGVPHPPGIRGHPPCPTRRPRPDQPAVLRCAESAETTSP